MFAQKFKRILYQFQNNNNKIYINNNKIKLLSNMKKYSLIP